MEFDFEDFVEEVKFQMTQFDNLTEELILGWEEKARTWIGKNKNKSYLKYKSADDIMIRVKSEELTEAEEIALKYYRAVRDNALEEYWKKFKLL